MLLCFFSIEFMSSYNIWLLKNVFFSGQHQIECTTEGLWSNESFPTCRPVDCGQPPDFPNGQFSVEGTVFRNRVWNAVLIYDKIDMFSYFWSTHITVYEFYCNRLCLVALLDLQCRKMPGISSLANPMENGILEIWLAIR